MNIFRKKSIIYLRYFDDEDIPEWVTKDMPSTDPFFIINNINKEKFRSEIWPLVKAGKYTIDSETLAFIKGYDLTVVRDYPPPSVQPEGIVLKDHQVKAASIMNHRKKYGFFLGTGTGKTLIAITYILNNQPNKVIIMTPKKVIGQYRKECIQYLAGYNITESLSEYLLGKRSILIINYEQLPNVIKGNAKADALILDESHYAKSYSSRTNTLLRELAADIPNVYLFTGTPQDHSRHEIFPQLAILDENLMPVKTKFNYRYFYLNDYYLPDREKRWLSDELTSMIESITWGKKTEDVVELTEEVNNVIKAEHPIKYYDELIKDRIVKIEDRNIVADNKASLRIKLRELSNGHVIDGTDTLRFNNTKDIELYNLLRDKVPRGIIYFEFTGDIRNITSVITRLNKSCVVVNGQTKDSHTFIERFKNSEVDYLVIQSRSGNAGLDLSHVNNVIFYSLPESYIVYHQCKSRIRRIGQQLECNYYHIICKETIEEQIYNSLKSKKSFSNKVFKIYK